MCPPFLCRGRDESGGDFIDYIGKLAIVGALHATACYIDNIDRTRQSSYTP
jgi:hypothetical protein